MSLPTYVKSLCTSLKPLKQELQSKLQALAATGTLSPGQGKKAFEDFLSSTASTAESTAARLRGIGTPSVNNGGAIADQFVKAFSRLGSSFKQAAAAAGSMPTSSRAEFAAAEQRIEANIRSSLAGLQSGFSALQSSQLAQAVKKEPACTGLTG